MQAKYVQIYVSAIPTLASEAFGPSIHTSHYKYLSCYCMISTPKSGCITLVCTAIRTTSLVAAPSWCSFDCCTSESDPEYTVNGECAFLAGRLHVLASLLVFSNKCNIFRKQLVWYDIAKNFNCPKVIIATILGWYAGGFRGGSGKPLFCNKRIHRVEIVHNSSPAQAPRATCIHPVICTCTRMCRSTLRMFPGLVMCYLIPKTVNLVHV